MKLLGLMFLTIFGLWWVVNASLMLVSPRLWFKLAMWSGTQGVFTEEKHSSGRGAVDVRMLGAIFLGGFVWVVYDAWFSR